MNIHSELRRLATITTMAAALGGCIEASERAPGELARGLDDGETYSQQLAGFSFTLLLGVTRDDIDGSLGRHLEHVIDGDVGVLVELSEQSSEGMGAVLTDGVDAAGWETPQSTLRSELEFVAGYNRFECTNEPCPWTDGLQLDEQDLRTHAQRLNQGLEFFAGQATVEQRLSGIPQMLLLASLQLMLRQEVVNMRSASRLDTAEADLDLQDAACSIDATLGELDEHFEARRAAYGEVTVETVADECTQVDGQSQCTHEQRVCFANPRGDDECRTRVKKYGDWGNDRWSPRRLVTKMEHLRDEWMQQDFDVILGNNSFSTFAISLKKVCGNEPTCEGHCGGAGASGTCNCDPSCLLYGDCCGDYTYVCTQ